jgi:hypothetical protein
MDGVLIMVARALWQATWWISELQMRFRRILVLFSLGVLVFALLLIGGPGDAGVRGLCDPEITTPRDLDALAVHSAQS